MVIESAVKHNTVSERKPLTIDIKKHQNYLVVSNVLQMKSGVENSTKTGLQNIEKRYLLLGKEGFKFSQSKESFNVYLPIIEVTE
jgi:LytS/YehU family sensor histidine kinase